MKNLKKILAVVMALSLMLTVFAACGKKADNKPADQKSGEAQLEPVENVKIGLICLHDENSTYDKNFIDALKEASTELGFEILIKTNIPESDACLTAAEELVEAGCNIIFADSFGHETYIIQAAEENPDVQFCHATGTMAHTEKLANFHNAFANIFEGRYLAGVAAGMKLNEMIESGKITADQAIIGYVGAFPYAEVKSGFTSFFLGARSVCPTATMKVTYTNSWFDIALEREAALNLINNGCVLISQHADSEGAPKACEEKGVPNVAYNISTIPMGPNTALISSKIDWAPYFKLIYTSVHEGKAIPTDYVGKISDGSVVLTELNDKVAAAGTQEKIDAVKAEIVAGNLKVFSTDSFTVKGEKLTTYMADIDSDEAFTKDTEVISDGYFHESEMRSAPCFDLLIDGITEI